MEKKDKFTKVLAIVGTVLLWFPLVVPLLFAIFAFFQRGRFLFDYFIPAEIFPVTLAGGLALVWASLRARARQWLIIGGLVFAVLLLVAGQAVAVATGLASGATEPAGWPWALVMSSMVLFWLGLILAGVGGILLIRDLFRVPKSQT